MSAYIWSIVNPVVNLSHVIDETDIPLSGHSRTMNPIRGKDPSPPISDQMDITKMMDDELKLRTQCKHYTYKLPRFAAFDFFGREDSIDELVSKLVTDSVQLLNINGPLGCGKSQLAIHLGNRLTEKSLSVSYIDISDRHLDQFPEYHYDPKKESLPTLSKVAYVHYPISIKNYTSIHDVVLMDELLNWSQTLTCNTVLILDNYDSANDNETFVDFVKSLISISSSPLKVVVTSQSYLEPFESWTIPELSMASSMKLLRRIAPSVSKQHLDKLLALLGGCPQTLIITGSILEHSQYQIDTILLQIELRELDMRVRSQHEQFYDLFNILYNSLSSHQRICGHYFSMFPGSFDKASGKKIIGALECDKSIDAFCRMVTPSGVFSW